MRGTLGPPVPDFISSCTITSNSPHPLPSDSQSPSCVSFPLLGYYLLSSPSPSFVLASGVRTHPPFSNNANDPSRPPLLRGVISLTDGFPGQDSLTEGERAYTLEPGRPGFQPCFPRRWPGGSGEMRVTSLTAAENEVPQLPTGPRRGTRITEIKHPAHMSAQMVATILGLSRSQPTRGQCCRGFLVPVTSQHDDYPAVLPFHPL